MKNSFELFEVPIEIYSNLKNLNGTRNHRQAVRWQQDDDLHADCLVCPVAVDVFRQIP